MNGYVRLFRTMADWRWHDDPNTLSVFVHLMIKANFTEAEWHSVKLQPGQLITSVHSLSVDTGLTHSMVRTSLRRLTSGEKPELYIKTTNKFTVVTLANWALYQSDDIDMTNKSQTNDKQMTNKSQQRNKVRRKEDILTTLIYHDGDIEPEPEIPCPEKKRPAYPTDVAEAKAYFLELKKPEEAEHFYDHYTANGWHVGKSPMKDWKAAARNWVRNSQSYARAAPERQTKRVVEQMYSQRDYDLSKFDGLTEAEILEAQAYDTKPSG